MKVLNATVKNAIQVTTKYGPKSVINLTTEEGNEGAIWGSENDQKLLSKQPGEHIVVGVDDRGKYKLVELSNQSNYQSNGNGNGNGSNGNGYQPQPQHEVLSNNVREQNINSNSHLHFTEEQIENELDLQILTGNDRKALKAFIDQRSKILAYCHESVKRDCGELGEIAEKSYTLSLFIEVCKNL